MIQSELRLQKLMEAQVEYKLARRLKTPVLTQPATTYRFAADNVE